MTQLKNNNLDLWHKSTESYRKNLDLATIFWLWEKVDENFHLYTQLDQIITLIGINNIHHISPRELWLGIACGVEKLDIAEADLEYLWVPPTEWKEIHQKAIIESGQSGNNFQKFSLNWFVAYRDKLKYITPFSDYYEVLNNAPYDAAPGRIRFIFRDTYPNKKPPTNRDSDDTCLKHYRPTKLEGITHSHHNCITNFYDYNDADIYEDECDYYRQFNIFHPILGDAKYTHSFIDLDDLILKAKDNGIEIPSALLVPPTENIYSPRSKTQSHHVSKPQVVEEIDSSNISLQPHHKPTVSNPPDPGEFSLEGKYDSEDQFYLLKITPEIIKYLNAKHHPMGKHPFKSTDNKDIKKELRTLTGMLDAHIEHIWRVITPRKQAKHLYLKDDLIKIKNELWEFDSPEDLVKMWRRTGSRDELLKKLKYQSNERLAFIALLSPTDGKVTGKLSEAELLKSLNLINGINLTWTENLSLDYLQ